MKVELNTMVASVADDAFSRDDGTSCDLEKFVSEYLEIPVIKSVHCASSTRYKLFFKRAVNDINSESFRELKSEFQHILEKNYLQIDLASLETEFLNRCSFNSNIDCAETLTILSNCVLDTLQTFETAKVSHCTLQEISREPLSSWFGRHGFKFECFVSVCRNSINWTRPTISCIRSICEKDWSFERSATALCGTTMEVHCNSHRQVSTFLSDCDKLLKVRRQEPSCTLCFCLGCSRIPSVTMTAEPSSAQLQDCLLLHGPSKEKPALSPLSEDHVRRVSWLQNSKASLEDQRPIINNYTCCKNRNSSNSTSCQSSSHNQLSRSRTVVSVNSSSHQRSRKCNVRRSNSSNYSSNCSSSVIVDNNRTISNDKESSLICCRSMPSFEDNFYLRANTSASAPALQSRRWSISSPCPRSRSPSSSVALLTSSLWTQQSASSLEHCDDTSLSSTLSRSHSKRLTQKSFDRRRRTRNRLLSTRSSDHSTADSNSDRSSSQELWREGGEILESCNLDSDIKRDTSSPPAPCSGADSFSAEGSIPSIRFPMEPEVTARQGSSSTPPQSGSVPSTLPRQRSSLRHGAKLLRTSTFLASPVAPLPKSSVNSIAPQLRQRRVVTTVEQGETVTLRSQMRPRTTTSKRDQRIHPLLGLWNLLTQFTYTSPANRRAGTTPFKMSQVWTCLLSVMLVVTVLPNVAESCSSRSTPRPRPSSPTLRPNITFQTYACPPAYAAWYCLNGATCFTVKIGESILYNCECADGYMGQRCEFKDLDGSYLPTREKVLLETASIAGGATVVIVLVFFVIFSVFLVRNRDKENRDMEGLSRINININSGAASSWPASGEGSHQSPSYTQRTSHTFVTSPTGALSSSPHTTTVSSPPHHLQPGQGCNHHRRHQAASVPTESVVDGKCFVSELGGGGGGPMVTEGGIKGRGAAAAVGEAFYGVPARVVRTVTTITDLASIYTNPRQEVHQVEVLQQVNVVKVDQSKARYNATFVRPSSNASTTALFRGPMWQEAPHSHDGSQSSTPLSWQQFKATSWLSASSSPPAKTQGNLSVMPQTNDKLALDQVPEASHVVVPYSEQCTRLAHSAVTLAMASHTADLDQPQPTTLILANAKMPFDLNSELDSRLTVDEDGGSTTVYISGSDYCANDQSSASDFMECSLGAESSRSTGTVNQAFDSGEENLVSRSHAGDQGGDKSSSAGGNAPEPLLFGAKNAEQY